MKRGKYNLKQRAERQQETRRRITEAAVELHRTVGGRQATISAIAQKAGVQRRTVYNHFPDEVSLVSACIAHYNAIDHPPNPESWAQIDDPEMRLRSALAEVYAYFGRNERLLANFAAAAHESANVREAAVPFFEHWERMRDVIAGAWQTSDGQHQLLLAALDLALDFQTWRTLVRRGGLDDERAIELMVCMVRCRTRD